MERGFAVGLTEGTAGCSLHSQAKFLGRKELLSRYLCGKHLAKLKFSSLVFFGRVFLGTFHGVLGL